MEGSGVSVSYLGTAPPPAVKPLDSQGKPSRGDDDGPSFGAILSALNPLQYVPVVGTIYRAITGDTIPEGLRIAGSFVASALTGGPLGMLLNAATTLAEKLTGIDPEAIAREVAEGLGIGSPAASPPPAVASPVDGPVLEAGTLSPEDASLAPLSTVRRQQAMERYARVALASTPLAITARG